MTLTSQLKEDLKRLTRLAANVADAHTCALFLPTGLLTTSSPLLTPISNQTTGSPITTVTSGTIELRRVVESPVGVKLRSIELVAAHSLAPTLARDCRIQVGSGLLGWVAEHGRPIHIAPFDADSSTLGIYADSEQLKSLAALPVPMPTEYRDAQQCHGVLMCDSKRPFSFSKTQVKLLEDVTTEISRVLFWALFKREGTSLESSWENFTSRAEGLASAIGNDSVEFLRIAIETFADMERDIGVSGAVRRSDQFFRLVQQALPPHFPVTRLPQGDILIALDNMMSAFFQNKIQTLVKHLGDEQKGFGVSITVFATKGGRARSLDIDSILQPKTISAKEEPQKALGGIRA
jgi:hypothetical protein